MKELRGFVSNAKHDLTKAMKQMENQKDSQISVLTSEITTLKAQVSSGDPLKIGEISKQKDWLTDKQIDRQTDR